MFDIANKLRISEKSIEKYWNGIGSFNFAQAQSIVDLFLGEDYYEYENECEGRQKKKKYGAIKYDTAKVLKPMLTYFLKVHDSDNFGYEVFLNKYYDASYRNTETQAIENENFFKHLSESAEAQQRVIDRINWAIQKTKHVFFSGPSGGGKRRKTNNIINNYISNHGYKRKICIDYETDEMTYANFLKKITAHFCNAPQDYSLGNVDKVKELNKLERKASEYLSHDKSIIFINGFDCFKDENDRKSIILFLKNCLGDENIVIITSTEAKNTYKYIAAPFLEVPNEEYTYKEWLTTTNSLKKEKPYCDAEKIYAKLYKLAYENGNKNLSRMITSLYEFSKQLVDEDLYDKFDIEANLFLFEQFLNDLDDDSRLVLVTLSLFSNPISTDIICGVSGIKDSSKILEILSALKSKVLIKMETTGNGTIIASLRNKIKFAIEKEKQHSTKYENIMNNWVKYYIDFTASKNENELKMDIVNIGWVLEFCDENDRFNEFSAISKNLC